MIKKELIVKLKDKKKQILLPGTMIKYKDASGKECTGIYRGINTDNTIIVEPMPEA